MFLQELARTEYSEYIGDQLGLPEDAVGIICFPDDAKLELVTRLEERLGDPDIMYEDGVVGFERNGKTVFYLNASDQPGRVASAPP